VRGEKEGVGDHNYPHSQYRSIGNKETEGKHINVESQVISVDIGSHKIIYFQHHGDKKSEGNLEMNKGRKSVVGWHEVRINMSI